MKRKKILSVEADGLRYKDEQGAEKFIDFASAAYFYSKLLQEWNGIDEQARIVLEKETKCVALRDVTAKPIYVKFLAETPVIFEFERGWFKQLYKEFRGLVNAVNDQGWTTFDLS